MDHVSQQMRHITTGHTVCIHTCVKGGCPNAVGNILWKKYGNSLRKHAINVKKHPFCDMSCPGIVALNMQKGKFTYSRDPTDEEYQGLSKLEPMDIDELEPMNSSTSPPLTFYNEISPFDSSTRDSTPYSNMSSVVDLDTDMFNVDDHHQHHIPMQDNNPCFRILYVPDPTHAAMTPALASADLAFLKTIITPDEYASMKHLTGSIHLNGRSGVGRETNKFVVYVQEWVCRQNVSMHIYIG